ncbi:hypothetical protein HDU96_002115 [Phlyctochytrium bullatum]|nr:hypothetical protein HDU96_002115 [Phlyctochytrium bullatum]
MARFDVMLGLCSLPNEVLRTVLLEVDPNDLITIASVNRHLHRAVPTCIDYALAKRHITEPEYFDLIYFNHPLLFQHSVAAFSLRRISAVSAWRIWGRNWQPGKRGKEAYSETLRLYRVRVLRAVVRKWGSVPVEYLEDAAEMAALMMSVDLFQDLCRAFPDITASQALRRFADTSAEIGFCDGLQMIPPEHPLLRDHGSRLLRVVLHVFYYPTSGKIIKGSRPPFG